MLIYFKHNRILYIETWRNAWYLGFSRYTRILRNIQRNWAYYILIYFIRFQCLMDISSLHQRRTARYWTVPRYVSPCIMFDERGGGGGEKWYKFMTRVSVWARGASCLRVKRGGANSAFPAINVYSRCEDVCKDAHCAYEITCNIEMTKIRRAMSNVLKMSSSREHEGFLRPEEAEKTFAMTLSSVGERCVGKIRPKIRWDEIEKEEKGGREGLEMFLSPETARVTRG